MTVLRPDISDHVVHFTTAPSTELAFSRFRTIVQEQCLVAGNSMIRGGYSCVCFSEAPLTSLEHGLVNPDAYSRYSPFGIMFEKSWLFAYGGRPVIYEPDVEFAALPESHRWRHVRYEPGQVDFTWEREWRIPCVQLDFSPNDVCLVVPDRHWAHRLIEEHAADEDFKVLQYSQVMDRFIAEQYRDDFPWRIAFLG